MLFLMHGASSLHWRRRSVGWLGRVSMAHVSRERGGDGRGHLWVEQAAAGHCFFFWSSNALVNNESPHLQSKASSFPCMARTSKQDLICQTSPCCDIS
jgi:hypothetical protein